MQPIALQYNLLLSEQALDPSLQSVVNQVLSAITSAFTEIKGATWSAATDTLEQIRDNAGGATASEIADAVWDESYAGHTTAGTFGKLMDLMRKSNRVIEGQVTGTPTDTVIPTNLTGYPDGAFDHEVFLLNGTGMARPILSYSATNGTITLQEPLPEAPDVDDDIVIIPQHVHPIIEIQNGLATEATVGSIKAKTDALTFTVAGVVDANIQYVNDIEVKGTGTTSDPWNPI